MDHLRSCLEAGLEVGETALEGATANPCPLQQVGNNLTLMMGLPGAGMSIGDLCVMAPDLLANGAALGNRLPYSTGPAGVFADGAGMDVDPANKGPSLTVSGIPPLNPADGVERARPQPPASPACPRTRTRSPELVPEALPLMEDVDLAHASVPEEPATTHQCAAGNMTPMRIHVSRPGFPVPAVAPAPFGGLRVQGSNSSPHTCCGPKRLVPGPGCGP